MAITIRNVPEEIRNKLAARAAGSGKSLQEYLLAELTASAIQLSVEDIINHIRPATATNALDVAEIINDVEADRR